MAGSIDEKVQNDVLPPPVLHTRFLKPNKVKVRWEKLKRRIGNGSAPDESLGDPTTDTSDSESHLARTRTGSRSAMSEKDDGVVDTVVVENEGRYCQWKEGQIKVSTTGASEPHETEGTPATYSGLRSDFASSRNTAFEQAGPLGYVYNYLRWTFYPRLHHFLFLKYHDDALEQAYRRELWWQQKHLHIFGGCFLLLNWILGVSTLPKPWSLFNKVTWYGVIPALAVPLAPMAAFDVPRRKAWVWQAFVCANIVYLSSMNLIEMHLCGYYTPHRNCGAKDFSATLMYAAGTPLLALFAMGMSRLTAIFSLLLWTGLVCGLILPDRSAWSRNLVNTVLLLSFMIWCHYRRDAMDRRVYTLRAELKVQFRAKQKSQINERKAADSKRRLTSYIFHEVRVPLNTALLAVQNLDAADAFKKDSELVVEYAALQGSLQMMSQVLNDVLDFSRMERGGFTSVSRPFSLHGAMKSVFGPLKLDANARALTLKTDLDPRVDEVARKALRDAGASQDDDSSGLVMGDEMRLRQVINNLCSNACKFTPAGGSVTVKTQLVYPSPADLAVEEEIKEVGTGDESNLTPSKLLQHNIDAGSSAEGELIVVRFEVTDTGFGIHPRDMAENRLFSPYIQSELGRRQGGKGTGLGLSLVRNIVMLSGGRLGVRSKLNHGSMFWIEMPFTVGKPVATAIEETDKLQALYSPAAMTVSSLSTKSEMAFMPSLKHSPSDNTLPPALEQAVAAVESAPANFLFSADLSTPSPVSPIDAAQKPPLQPIRTQATPDELARPPPPQPLEHANSAPATVPTVTFPTDVARESLSSRGSTVADKEPLNVLVVDDDLLTRKLMTRMMERLGCRVSTAENGQIALELILADKAVDPKRILYDLICLDNQMPLVSGLQVASRLRGHERDDFIVGVTANAQLAEQEEYIERGANFVLTKPVLEADLKRMIALAEKRRADRRAKAATGKAENVPTNGDE